MVLKIYGSSRSTCTRLVGVICKEKEIPYELITVDIPKREHKSAEYLKFQPFGQLPYIDDDGFILYECRAICRYLIKKYPNQGTQGLIPTDPKEEALFEQAVSVEAFNYHAYAMPLVYEKVIKPLFNYEPNEAKIRECYERLGERLDAYDVILSKQKYVAGDHVTLADLQHLPYGYMLYIAGRGDVIDSRPNVLRWWKDISGRPTWQSVQHGA